PLSGFNRYAAGGQRTERLAPPLWVVATLSSNNSSHASPNTQYRLLRSSRSIPIVSFLPSQSPFPFLIRMLCFFIAGLLSIAPLSASFIRELNASRRRPAFSSHLDDGASGHYPSNSRLGGELHQSSGRRGGVPC